jgi:hypothetical protein
MHARPLRLRLRLGLQRRREPGSRDLVVQLPDPDLKVVDEGMQLLLIQSARLGSFQIALKPPATRKAESLRGSFERLVRKASMQ